MKIEKNEEREERIIMEIVVDAYDEYERASGWYHYLQDEITFPFMAKAMSELRISPLKKGELMKVVDLADMDDCERQIYVQVELDGREFGAPLAQLEFLGLTVDDEILIKNTKEAIKDWHYWIQQGYVF